MNCQVQLISKYLKICGYVLSKPTSKTPPLIGKLRFDNSGPRNFLKGHVMAFEKGHPVITPLGKGIVVFCRMAAPNYSVAAAYSVRLDSRKHEPQYTGTMFSVNEVSDAKNSK